MQHRELPENNETVTGLDALRASLDSLLEKVSTARESTPKEYIILFQLGGQQSLIKVDTSLMPFHFVYDDLLGRPATNAVKEVIARFIWEKCGEKERYLKEQTEGDES